jgi:hypothetical protein
MSIRTRPLLLLAVLAAVFALAATIAIPTAHPAEKRQDRAPTLLWNSYPLEQRPRAAVPRVVKQGVVPTKEASRHGTPQSGRPLENLVLLSSVLLATLLVFATIVLLRSSVPVRAASSMRHRVRARSARPVRRPRSQKTRPTREDPPPLREVTAGFAPEPETAGGETVEPEPIGQPPASERFVERTAAAAETRRPEPQPSPEPALELQLRELVERKHAATPAARPELEREIEALHERIETRSAETPEPKVAAVSLARCEIRLWRGFVKCQLYAALAGSDESVALSQYFRLQDDLVPNDQARHALATLVGELEQGGWTVVSGGRPWYRHTLELVAPRSD